MNELEKMNELDPVNVSLLQKMKKHTKKKSKLPNLFGVGNGKTMILSTMSRGVFSC